MEYRPRALEPTIRRITARFPVVLLTGPRQTGKTTLLRHLAGPDRTYVTLDDPAFRDLARHDPRLFLQRYPAPVLIDEIQYAPEPPGPRIVARRQHFSARACRAPAPPPPGRLQRYGASGSARRIGREASFATS